MESPPRPHSLFLSVAPDLLKVDRVCLCVSRVRESSVLPSESRPEIFRERPAFLADLFHRADGACLAQTAMHPLALEAQRWLQSPAQESDLRARRAERRLLIARPLPQSAAEFSSSLPSSSFVSAESRCLRRRRLSSRARFYFWRPWSSQSAARFPGLACEWFAEQQPRVCLPALW